jgi:hypothetical protein
MRSLANQRTGYLQDNVSRNEVYENSKIQAARLQKPIKIFYQNLKLAQF